MSPIIANFTPGPSQLYGSVADHVRKGLREGVGSLSHRSVAFEKIVQHTHEGLRSLLSIPDNFHIFFLGSATEIWERSMQNLVAETSFHLVNGAFSKRFYETALQLKKNATIEDVALGKGFDAKTLSIPKTELIALTHNETSTGVAMPLSCLKHVREKNPEALIVVDAVSSLPYPAFDFKQFDSVFFSVQKGFGLPAGLGVWMVNERCIEKAHQLERDNFHTGSYHSLASLLAHAKKNQTPETPNVLAIYLLGQVIDDMLARGIQTIRRETDYKAAIFYQALHNHPLINAFVKDTNDQSKTVMVADCGEHIEAVTQALLSNGLQAGEGYGALKKSQLRFANFPAHSKEQFELLVDTLAGIK